MKNEKFLIIEKDNEINAYRKDNIYGVSMRKDKDDNKVYIIFLIKGALVNYTADVTAILIALKEGDYIKEFSELVDAISKKNDNTYLNKIIPSKFIISTETKGYGECLI